MCFEQKEVINRVVDEEEGGLDLGTPYEEENDWTMNLGRNSSSGLTRGATDSLPQGSVVQWDRFLPIRTLKVLLVENDDSTRHVVSALLRNCSYEVNGVANGLQAWKVLEDPNNHTDIILTEVVMPVISGIALLCKIMSHKSLKNIPVIMMSSHDSMGLVFKCLSKGAVDFLVKPIRKNELKNLWQHVWRRCHSSSGSGSESGTQSRIYARPKSNRELENDSGSYDDHDNGSTGQSIRDKSDQGSGTQSSREDDVNSPHSVSHGGQLADSTCAQFIHAKPEKDCSESRRFNEVSNGKCLEIGVARKPEVSHQEQNLESVKGSANANCSTEPQTEGRVFGTLNGVSDITHIKRKCESGDCSPLELSLKRLRGSGDAVDDCNVLRHSDLSAFSKYNTLSSANQQEPTGNVGSCSLFGSNSVAPTNGASNNFRPNSNTTPPNQQSNESSNNNNDVASTNKYIVPKPEFLAEKPDPKLAFKSSHTSAFHPTQKNSVPQEKAEEKEKEKEEQEEGEEQEDESCEQGKIQHHHHHHHHYHHHVHNLQEDGHDDASLKNMAVTAQQCGSSNGFGDSHAGKRNVNESVSGSNGQNGSSTVLNAGMVSDNGVTGNSGGKRNGWVGNGIDENRAAQREAALTKFRQKRKDRCFEKRVRYQSRKKLAEQRPRIRGQFVRQKVCDSKEGEDCMSEDFRSEDNNSGSSVR